MSLLLLLDPQPVVSTNPAVELDTFLISVTFPESSVVADRGATGIVAADPSTSIMANDPTVTVGAV